MKAKCSKEQLASIREQAVIYQCACPAQVSELVSGMQNLYKYQEDCLNRNDVDVQVHRTIADATAAAYGLIEQCLTDVLRLEGWDLDKLEMPECLRQRLLKQIEQS